MQRGKMEILEPVWWEGDAIGYIDQRALPHVVERRRASTTYDVVEAIATLAVRGAADEAAFAAEVEQIRAARPTAVNLARAVDRVRARGDGAYLEEARRI